MKEPQLRAFLLVLQNRLKGHEAAIKMVDSQTTPGAAPNSSWEISRVITQAHINELEFAIEELEGILAA